MAMRLSYWKSCLVSVGVMLATGTGFANAAVAASATPVEITGPIIVTAESGEPFRGTNAQPVAGPGLPPPVLIPYDFVEEEYFISGVVDGKSYKAAILVRKPRDPVNFSGVVAVETIHLAGAIPFWGGAKVWLEGNHGWVAVASQKGALDGHLKRTNPRRYLDLEIPDVSKSDDQPMRSREQDLFSQHIMTQVGALLKSNTANGPFKGMQVKHLLMGGSSQTGGTTLRYIADSHDQARMPDGSPIYDGYAPWEAFSADPVVAKDSVIVHMVTEGDVMNYLLRDRPMSYGEDTDSANGGYRHYQVAGASHVGTRGPAADALKAYGTLDNLGPDAQPSSFPHNEILSPANAFLIDWVSKGIAPPRVKPLLVENGEIRRDEYGIAKGGVRSPYVDLPTVRYIAAIPPEGSLFGLEEPIPVEKLLEKYGSRDGYLKEFNEQINEMSERGWLFTEDADVLKQQEAERSLF